jgi:hypothetical protein
MRRMGDVVHQEKVSGWTASKVRIAALVDQVRSGGGHGVPSGVTIY